MNCGPGTSEPANTYHISVGVSFVHLTLRELIYLFVYFRYPVANYIDVDKCRGMASSNQYPVDSVTPRLRS